VEVMPGKNIANLTGSAYGTKDNFLRIGNAQGALALGTDSTLISFSSASLDNPGLRLRNVNGNFHFDYNTPNGTGSTIFFGWSTNGMPTNGNNLSASLIGVNQISSYNNTGNVNHDFYPSLTTQYWNVRTTSNTASSSTLVQRFAIGGGSSNVTAYFNAVSAVGINTTSPVNTLDIAGTLGISGQVSTITSGAITLSPANGSVAILFSNASGGAVTFTLPDPSSSCKYATYKIKNASPNNQLVKTASAGTVLCNTAYNSLASSVTIGNNGVQQEWWCDGTYWYLIN
jgi:hypothetical protein